MLFMKRILFFGCVFITLSSSAQKKVKGNSELLKLNANKELVNNALDASYESDKKTALAVVSADIQNLTSCVDLGLAKSGLFLNPTYTPAADANAANAAARGNSHAV